MRGALAGPGALFAVTQVTRNIPAPGHDAGVEHNLPRLGAHTMYIDITWKIGLPALVGLFVIATVVMNGAAVSASRTGTDSRAVAAPSAPSSSVCNIVYPIPCSYIEPR
jgi:hypothetical protein